MELFHHLVNLTICNIISASKEMSLTVSTDDKHIYFCYPINSINDRIVFNVGGFEGGSTLLG